MLPASEKQKDLKLLADPLWKIRPQALIGHGFGQLHGECPGEDVPATLFSENLMGQLSARMVYAGLGLSTLTN